MVSPPSGIWLASPTRFFGASRAGAWIMLVFLAIMMGLSLTTMPRRGPAAVSHNPANRAEDQADIVLYERIVDGVRHGGGYYRVAASALRHGHYPLRPFIAMRGPTLAVFQAHLPKALIITLLYLLIATTVVIWMRRLSGAVTRLAPLGIAMALLGAGLMAFVERDLWSFHEIWAGLLISLSLALRRPERWGASVALGLAAMLIRETAALYVLIMAAAALVERRFGEAIGWCVALAIFAAALGAHAWAVHQVTSAADPASPGWSGLQGAGFFVLAIVITTALRVLPVWLGTILCVLSLFGWIAWRDQLGGRVAGTLIAYGVLLSCFARPDNFYWALLIAPTALAGLIFVPDALRDLFDAALDKRRGVVRG